MAYVLLVGDDSGPLEVHRTMLRSAGYEVVTTSSTTEAIGRLTQGGIGLVVTLTQTSSLDILRRVQTSNTAVPVLIFIGEPARAVERTTSAAHRAALTETATAEAGLLAAVERAWDSRSIVTRPSTFAVEPQAHAAVRWAKAVVPLVDCPADPRTVAAWSRWIAASPGAIKNWCSTAGIGARRSLVFARILRAVVLSEGGRRKPENLLDIVDRRTLAGLFRLAGLSIGQFPRSTAEFLEQQILVRDPAAFSEVRRLLADRERLGYRMTSAVGKFPRFSNLRVATHDPLRFAKTASSGEPAASVTVDRQPTTEAHDAARDVLASPRSMPTPKRK